MGSLFKLKKKGEDLEARIAAGEFGDTGGSTKEKITRPVRRFLANDPLGLGRFLALQLAKIGREWTAAASKKMPVGEHTDEDVRRLPSH